jgi:hypothetical protein
MKSKMDSMYANKVLTLVDLPKGIKLIGSKLVFKRKSDINGNLQAYKVILVVKCYKQRQRFNFDETFL